MNPNLPAPLGELADMVRGALWGDPAIPITGAWPLDEATRGSITLVDHPDRVGRLAGTLASAVVLPREVEPGSLPAVAQGAIAAVVVADVHDAFARLVLRFRPRPARPTPSIHPRAIVAPTARLGVGVTIGPGAVVGERVVVGDRVTLGPNAVVGDDSWIGDDSVLAANVTLYDQTVVGRRCRLHSGVVLGADGFGYRQVDGHHRPVAQLGNVVLGDDVEVGANSTIDRGVYGPTRVGDGTKIDNLVQIAHNCRIGRHNLLCSQVGIAGSTSTGDYVIMAGQVGVRDHVHIGERAILSAMAGVSNDVRAGEVMLGIPATPLREQKLQMAAVAKLPEMRKEVRAIRADLEALTRAVAAGDESQAADPDAGAAKAPGGAQRAA